MTDSILIVGAGVAGLHAAMECAAGGARAIVVERRPVVGGRLAAAMTNATAIGNRAEGLKVPLFEALEQNERIEILTSSDLEQLDVQPDPNGEPVGIDLFNQRPHPVFRGGHRDRGAQQ